VDHRFREDDSVYVLKLGAAYGNNNMHKFGQILKEWRGVRRFSQLDLAMAVDMSARHLSFLETGRANPSRNMVLRLSQALNMPRPVTNQALRSAGYSAYFPEMTTDAPALEPVRRAIDMMLDRHDPYPGVAVDRHWNILSANKAGQLLMSLSNSLAPIEPGGEVQPNLIALLIASADLPLVENWREVASLALIRLRSEIAAYGGDPVLEDMAERLAQNLKLQGTTLADIELDQAVIPTILRLGDARLSLFSTIAEFGSVQDVQAGELRIELMFPMDDETAGWFTQNYT
jgi:transcriptional regulator with XRE-family HTH domain